MREGKGRPMPLTPPLSCRTSPPQVGRLVKGTLPAQSLASENDMSPKHAVVTATRLKMTATYPASRSPSLWGRCPAGQRGVSPTLQRNNENTPQSNQHLTEKPTKNIKNPPALLSTSRESPAQSPRSALGYTARRCGEAEPALVVKGYANLHCRGPAANPPAATGGERHRFRTGWCCSPDVRTGSACLPRIP